MSERKIKELINEILPGAAKKSALEFISFLAEHEIVFEKCTGYWENQFYWLCKLSQEYVCFILLNKPDAPEEKGCSWVVWSDDSNSDCYRDFPLSERMKTIAWNYVDRCSNCGSCGGGTNKVIFGKEFTNVCRTTFRFDDPDGEALEFMKEMIAIRKNAILMNNGCTFHALD